MLLNLLLLPPNKLRRNPNRNYMRHFLTSIIIILVGVLCINPQFVLAVDYPANSLPFGSYNAYLAATKNKEDQSFKLSSMYTLELGRSDPLTSMIKIINIVLTFLGFAGMVVLVYAGVLWATAQGNSEQVEKSKHFIRRSALGLVIILMASAINILVFYLIQSQFYAKIG